MAAAAALGLAGLAAGCGSERPSGPAAPAAPAPARLPQAAAPPAEEAAPVDLDAVRRRAAKRALARAAAREARNEQSTARRTARTVAELLGFRGASVVAGRAGRRVVVRLTPPSSCLADATDVAAIRDKLRATLPSAREVRVLGADAGSCPPAGVGRVQYAHRGRGTYISPAIRVRDGATLEYEARGSFLQILVTEGRRLVARPIDGLRGARKLHANGRVRLRVAGDGAWVVRVREASR